MLTLNTFLTSRGYVIKKNELTLEQINTIKKELTVTPYNNPKEYDSFKIYTNTKKSLILPKFYGVSKFGLPLKIKRPKKNKIKINFKGVLRSKQIPIVNKTINYLKQNKGYGGILVLPCGFGKTTISINIICKLKRKTLVIVHKSFLQEQWVERIKQFTDAKIGIIRQNIIDIEGKDIVIAMLQSLSMKDYGDNILKQFSFIVCDECHHFAARVFSNALVKTCPKYILGLSATPNRKDKLTKVLHWFIGNTIHKEKRQPNKFICVRSFLYTSNNELFKEKKRWIKGKINPDTIKMTTNLTILKDRNIFIVKIINELRKIEHRKILVLSHRINHIKLLKSCIDKLITKDEHNGKVIEKECTTSLYIGKMKKNELKQSENADIIFGSVSMAEEGLDISDLNSIILASPKKEIEQAIGRILRKHLKDMIVPPLIIDIHDKLSVFDSWGNKRNIYYQSNKYTVKKYNAYNNKLISKKKYLTNKLGSDKDITFSELSQQTPLFSNILNIDSMKLSQQCTDEEVKIVFQKPDITKYMFS